MAVEENLPPPPSTLPQICTHFNKGTCKFGDRCKVIHDHRNRAGLSSQKNSGHGNVSSYVGIWNPTSASTHVRPAHTHTLFRPVQYQPSPSSGVTPTAYYAGLVPASYPAQQPVAQFQQPQPVSAQQSLPAHYQPYAYAAQQQPVSHGQPGLLGPALVIYPSQATSLPSAFSTMTLQDPTWNMDTCASSHLNSNASNLSTIFNQRLCPSVHVGDGNFIPVTNIGHIVIPSIHRPLHLNNILVTPNIIKNLIYVRQFTGVNNCTIEFDAFGFSVKDFMTRHILLRCDSSGDLYPVTKPSTLFTAFVSTSSSTWHQRLGHPGDEVLRSLTSHNFMSCNKAKSTHVCHACQLGKHVKLLFHNSTSIVKHCFDIIHSDLWISPIVSSSGFKYYVLFLDHFSHFLWIYPLRSKYDMFDNFFAFSQLC
ncbi:ribonuclease H-like domain-containing protein [Tanacetum coccineum]